MFKLIKEYKQLKYLAYHDTLTGLLNRNWLRKNKHNISFKYVYFIDINNLGEVNKKGHTFGDLHIIMCVESINIMTGDYLVRYAGDEFILFTNRNNAIKTNKLYSVGFCEVNNDIDLAINMADSDMIKSKNRYKSAFLKN